MINDQMIDKVADDQTNKMDDQKMDASIQRIDDSTQIMDGQMVTDSMINPVINILSIIRT